MAHTFTKNHLHVVFSTKQRAKLISPKIRERLWQYTTGICNNVDLVPVAIGGMDDHLHMLFHLPPALALADAVRLVKTNSSKWMNEHQSGFGWQEGYGAFAVSASNVAEVVNYIHNQEKHHRKMSFEDEYLQLLRKHGVDFDVLFSIDRIPVAPAGASLSPSVTHRLRGGLQHAAPGGAGLSGTPKSAVAFLGVLQHD